MLEIIQVYKLYSYYIFLYTVDCLYNKICVQVLMDCPCLCLYVCVHKIYLFPSTVNLWIFLYVYTYYPLNCCFSFFFSCVLVYGVYSCVHKCDPVWKPVFKNLPQLIFCPVLLEAGSLIQTQNSEVLLVGLAILLQGNPYLLFLRLQYQLSCLMFVWVLGMSTLVLLLACKHFNCWAFFLDLKCYFLN